MRYKTLQLTEIFDQLSTDGFLRILEVPQRPLSEYFPFLDNLVYYIEFNMCNYLKLRDESKSSLNVVLRQINYHLGRVNI